MNNLKLFIISSLGIFADQLHKYYMINIYKISQKAPAEIFEYLNFVMVWNRGISFGMFNNLAAANYFFIFFSTCVVIFIIFLANKTINKIEHLSFCLIVGGAIGNIIDRINYGAVADFFDFHIKGYHWPAFNIADALIFCGAALFILSNLFY
ncbi:MAG TPA: signal peptidase II, partial [Alphaproteobacteria bacterium]|nr:signal peptidase II [Alphaproteobacteria bacterium]